MSSLDGQVPKSWTRCAYENMKTVFLYLLSILFLCSCARPYQTYEGRKLDPSDVAVLAAQGGKIVGFDGRDIFEKSIELLPGAHSLAATFVVRTSDLGFLVRDDFHGKLMCRVKFFAKPGLRYEIFRSDPAGEKRKGPKTRMYHVVTIRNADSAENIARGRCRWK